MIALIWLSSYDRRVSYPPNSMVMTYKKLVSFLFGWSCLDLMDVARQRDIIGRAPLVVLTFV